MKKFFKWFIGVFAVLLLVGGFFFLSPVIVKQSSLGVSTDVFCNDYEFTCCVPTTSAPVTTSVGATSLYQCPSTATSCEVKSYSPSLTYIFTSVSAPTIRNLFKNLYVSLYDSPDMVMKQSPSSPFTIPAGSYVWADRLTSISYTVGGQKLTFCGRAGCTQGVDIKSDSCAFTVSTGKIYDASTKSDKGVSYTVPSGQCVLAWQSSDRHICGTILDECTTTADCVATHQSTCSARTLQSYECRPASSLPSTVAYVNGQYVSSSQDPFDTVNNQYTRNQCQIATAQPVQCCGDSDCGSSATCDLTSHTCKAPAQVTCVRNSDCGVSMQCDYTKNQLKTPTCTGGSCGFVTKSVGCCSDVNCATGSFCNANYVCEVKNPSIVKACPFACCVGDATYVNKSCNVGSYCVNNACQSDAQCSATKPCATGLDCVAGVCKSVSPATCSDSLGGLVKSSIGVKNDCNFFCQVGLQSPQKIDVCVSDYTPLALLIVFVLAVLSILVFGLKKRGKGKKGSSSGESIFSKPIFWKILIGIFLVGFIIYFFGYIFWIIVGLVVLLIVDATLLRGMIRREIFG